MLITLNIQADFSQPIAAADFLRALQPLMTQFASLESTLKGSASRPLNSASAPSPADSDAAVAQSPQLPRSGVAPNLYDGEQLRLDIPGDDPAPENCPSVQVAAVVAGNPPPIAASIKVKRKRRSSAEVKAEKAREVELRAAPVTSEVEVPDEVPVPVAALTPVVTPAPKVSPATASVTPTEFTLPVVQRLFQQRIVHVPKADPRTVAVRSKEMLAALGIAKFTDMDGKPEVLAKAAHLMDTYFPGKA